jgi:hypothetical protein
MSHKDYIVKTATDFRKNVGMLSVYWIAETFNLPIDEAQTIFNEIELTSIMTGLKEGK